MEGQKIPVPIFTQLAKKHGKGNPQPKHDEQDEARRRLVNQNFSEADNQSNPNLGRVQMMDPFGNGFHALQDISTRSGEAAFPIANRRVRSENPRP
jgi:hypothetical protein